MLQKCFIPTMVSAFLFLVFPATAQDFSSSHLPIIVIETDGVEIEDEPKVLVTMGIINNENGINHLSDPYSDYDGKIGIELRGNTTQDAEKKSFSIELRDNSNNDLDASLLGLPPEEDWILHASPFDKTFLRNHLSFEIWRQMGYWASNIRYCELLLDGEYMGLYLLMERNKRDKNRLNIAKLGEDDISGDDLTGGYIIRLDWPEDEGWNSSYRAKEEEFLFYQYFYPKTRDIKPEQAEYIKSYFDSFEDALFSASFTNNDGLRYDSLMDVSSFADLFIINELSRSVDAYKLSTFFHKDKDSNGGLLKAGPIWDFNLAYGNADYCGATTIEGWTYRQDDEGCDDLFLMPQWWEGIISDPAFFQEVRQRWQSHRNDFLNVDFLFQFIDQQVWGLGQAVDRNYARWDFLGQNMFAEPEPVLNSYDAEVNLLKNWLDQRLQWLDQQLVARVITDLGKNPIPGIMVFPNPSSSSLHIFFRDLTDIDLHVMDLTGKEVLRENGLNDQYVYEEFQFLSSGTYIVRLSSSTFDHTKMVIKQ